MLRYWSDLFIDSVVYMLGLRFVSGNEYEATKKVNDQYKLVA